MIKWNTGCSGFYNKHWKGIFYPETLPQSKWLNFYCEHLNSLELNVTFYRFPTEKLMKSWFDKSPENFKFSVKAPKIITHYKKFRECKNLLNDFYSICEKGLKNKLGCLLFQFPPSIVYSEELLEHIVLELHSGFRNVLEFRHPSWWNKEVYEVLAKREIIFCSVSHPKLPGDIIVNRHILYLRLHGVPEMFYSRYKHAELEKLVFLLKNKNELNDAYIYFNNTATSAGIENVLEFNKLIDHER
jgi:uncharacterized protein YecE (DUF72 family)